MLMNREQICSLIPHEGNVCVLDGVVAWDAQEITCLSRSHLSPDNPLRSNGILSSLHLVEYAAQAMAIHGGLLAKQQGRSLPAGYLVALRGVRLSLATIHQLDCDLTVSATQLLADQGNMVYSFNVAAVEQPTIAAGRLTVVSQAGGVV